MILKKRIYYHHTDAGGVVYYSRYLEFLEEARTLFLEEKGISILDCIERGFFFVVAHQEIDYKAPAFYGQELTVDTYVTKVGAAKVVFEATIRNEEEKLVAQAQTVLVCVDKSFKVVMLPQDIRKRLEDGLLAGR